MIGIDGINATRINMCQYFLWKRRELAGGGSDNEQIVSVGHCRLNLQICRLFHANICKFDAEIK